MKRKAALCLSVLVFAVLVVTACSNAGQKQEEIPNPMVRYDTIDQIEKKVGYSPAILPAYSGFELKEMYIIGSIASLAAMMLPSLGVRLARLPDP